MATRRISMNRTPKEVIKRAFEEAFRTKQTRYIYRIKGAYAVHSDPILEGQQPRVEVSPTGKVANVRFDKTAFRWTERRLPVLEKKIGLVGTPKRGKRLIR